MLKFSEVIHPNPGGTEWKINVDAGRKPFGQIWWFTHHTSTVHAKTLAGDHFYAERGTLDERVEKAKAWMRRQAGEE